MQLNIYCCILTGVTSWWLLKHYTPNTQLVTSVFTNFNTTCTISWCVHGHELTSNWLAGWATTSFSSKGPRHVYSQSFSRTCRCPVARSAHTFVISVRLPALCRRLPLNRFSWDLIQDFYENLWRKTKFGSNRTKPLGILHCRQRHPIAVRALCYWNGIRLLGHPRRYKH